MIRTYNFKIEPYVYEEGRVFYKGEFRDERNGFICVDPTADIECYLNYIELLNFYRDRWKSYAYLDYGMMPLVMPPSFFPRSMIEKLIEAVNTYKITCYSLPPVSFMFAGCKLPDNDIWIFKREAAEKTGMPLKELSLERFIRRYIQL